MFSSCDVKFQFHVHKAKALFLRLFSTATGSVQFYHLLCARQAAIAASGKKCSNFFLKNAKQAKPAKRKTN